MATASTPPPLVNATTLQGLKKMSASAPRNEKVLIEAAEANKSTLSEEEETCDTFWDVLWTVYLPVVFFWLRRSMFGTVLLMGQFICWFLTTYGPATSNIIRCPSFLEPLLKQKDAHSWPPPALVALAILTIVAFIVHPDGMTWIVLGKVRDGIWRVAQSLQACVLFLLQDYGILPTLVASVTLFCMFGVIYALHRTLAPRRRNVPPPPTPKRKKKKHHKNSNHARGRTLPPHRQKSSSQNHRSLPPDDVKTEAKSKAENDDLVERREEPSTNLEQVVLPPKDEEPALPPNRARVESRDSTTGNVTDDQSCDGSASVRTVVTTQSEQSDRIRAAVDGVAQTKPKQNKSNGGAPPPLSWRRNTPKRGKKSDASGHRPKPPRAHPASSFSQQSLSPTGRFASLAPSRSDHHSRRHPQSRRSRRAPDRATSAASSSSSSFFSEPSSSYAPRGTVERSSPAVIDNLDRSSMSTSMFSSSGPTASPTNTSVRASSQVSPPPGLGNIQYSVPLYTSSSPPPVSPALWNSPASTIRPPPGLSNSMLLGGEASMSEAPPLFPSPSRPTGPLNLPELEPKTSCPEFSTREGEPCAPFVAQSSEDMMRKVEEESSRIEAELQELGGQMVGSILD